MKPANQFGSPTSVKEWTGIFKMLSDETRLRILSLLLRQELAVGELQRILGIGQSTLSTQLSLLKDHQLLGSRKEGKNVFYRVPDAMKLNGRQEILQTALSVAEAASWYERDQRYLLQILQERSESSRSFFNEVANQNKISPGQTWKSLGLGLARLIHNRRIADLGCGNGRLSCILAASGNRVVGIDNSEAQIKLARENGRSIVPSPEFLLAEMHDTGLPDQCFDIVVLSQSLHHSSSPRKVLAEAARILEPGGNLLVLDLLKHEEEWMHQRWGDFWLGFDPAETEGWLRKAGFENIHHEIPGRDREHSSIESLLLTATKAFNGKKAKKQ